MMTRLAQVRFRPWPPHFRDATCGYGGKEGRWTYEDFDVLLGSFEHVDVGVLLRQGHLAEVVEKLDSLFLEDAA
jgi:hypothetical protein